MGEKQHRRQQKRAMNRTECSKVRDKAKYVRTLPSTGVIQLTLTLKSQGQVVETLVNVNNNSSIQDYVYPDDETQPAFEMTAGFKPFA